MEATLITTENKKRKIQVDSFEQVKKIISNYDGNIGIEVVTLQDGTALLIDEDGKLKNLPYNDLASALAHEKKGIYPSDFIVGDAILIDLDEFDSLPYE